MPVKQLAPDESAIAEIQGMRYRDLKDVSKRLGRCSRWSWANVLLAFGLLVLGADAGAWIAMYPYVTTNPPPSHENKLVYLLIAVAVGVVGLVGLVGGLVARTERTESVGHIKQDLDELLAAWQADDGA